VSDLATWDDVRRVALTLPEVDEQSSRDGLPVWRVAMPEGRRTCILMVKMSTQGVDEV
jgi:hypothetical protein